MAQNNLDKLGDYMPHLSTAGSGASIGGTIGGSPTEGSVLFVGASGALAQDNANFFWDDTDNQLVLGAGTVGKPSLIFTDDTTGFYRPGANQLALSISGTLAMLLGTGTAPDSDQTLAIGRILLDSRQTDAGFLSHRDQTGSGAAAVFMPASGANQFNSTSGQNCLFATGGSTRWLINGTTFQLGPSTDNNRDFGSTALRIQNMFVGGYYEGSEIADPAAPGADKARLYFRDNGAGKTQLVVRFPTGAVQVIATEP